MALGLWMTPMTAETRMGKRTKMKRTGVEYLAIYCVDSWKLRQKGGKKKRQQRARQKAAQAAPFGPPPKVIHSQAHREQPRHETTFNAKDVRASLRALEEDDCEVIEWNDRAHITSSDPKVIVDAEGRIIAVLLGRPEGDNWDEVIKEMERLMKALRRRGRKLGIFSAKKESHRRGKFDILNDALTMGPGQRRPGNLLHTRQYRRLLHHFLKSKAARRIIGFQSTRYFPKLWQYMAHTMEGIQENQPTLRRPFENSVYPAFSANLGPNTVTFQHCDGHNLAHGVCPITSFGKFNHKIGGHLYMRQLKLAIEFPSGSSVAIMSGAFDHGNAPIMKGETRYSMTQYAAGALFRWSAYGYQTAKTLLATPGGVRRRHSLTSGSMRERWVCCLNWTKLKRIGAKCLMTSVFNECSCDSSEDRTNALFAIAWRSLKCTDEKNGIHGIWANPPTFEEPAGVVACSHSRLSGNDEEETAWTGSCGLRAAGCARFRSLRNRHFHTTEMSTRKACGHIGRGFPLLVPYHPGSDEGFDFNSTPVLGNTGDNPRPPSSNFCFSHRVSTSIASVTTRRTS
ncbi:hypothetical protein B0H14DRAFT_3655328 [Mycena olivaceomarginata]|nr:hypothetical protein B0H14DRAFT_3655328 [Mycena olivaceomarginata]